jgi:hypothetical protein
MEASAFLLMVASTGSATAMLLCNLTKVYSSLIDKKTYSILPKKNKCLIW